MPHDTTKICRKCGLEKRSTMTAPKRMDSAAHVGNATMSIATVLRGKRVIENIWPTIERVILNIFRNIIRHAMSTAPSTTASEWTIRIDSAELSATEIAATVREQDRIENRERRKSPETKERLLRYNRAHANTPQRKARNAVNHAIKNGDLPSPKTLPCAYSGCTKHATHYHHTSYDEAHWLDVQAVCTEHHGKLHWTVIGEACCAAPPLTET